MSVKTEYTKKWIIEILEKKNVDILDEIVHPEYFTEQHTILKEHDLSAITVYVDVKMQNQIPSGIGE